MDATLARAPLRPPNAEGLGRGVLFALLVHGVLVVALTLGVNWRMRSPAGVEAELWAAVPQVAAPRAQVPPPAPQPVPPPQPERAAPPVPKVEPPPAPSRDAEIAVEKARREKIQRENEARERAEQLAREKARKAEQDKRDKELAKRKAAEELKKKQEAQRKAAEEELRQAQEREEARKKNLERIQGLAGATGAPGSTGTAAQSAGPSASYAGRLKARIKPNIVFTDDVPSNPSALVEVRAAPDGTVLSRRLLKPSGTPSWDDAVLRAIDRTEVLPRDTDGRVPSPIEIEFRPRE